MNSWVAGLGALVLGGAAGAGACVVLGGDGGEILDPSVAVGTVFVDADGDGEQDEGEAGVPGAAVLVTTDSSTVRVLTSPEGAYRIEMPVERFTVSVDTSTLGFPGQLTTARESWSLDVPPEYTAVGVDFGYQEVEPSEAFGTVFEDLDGDGAQSEGEPGIPGVTVLVVDLDLDRSTGDVVELTTDAQGGWTFETASTRFEVVVDAATLPFPSELTSARDSYVLNVPPGFVAVNVDFGYREAPGGTASGVVFEDLDGDGTQQDDEPGLGGVDVALLAQDGSGDVVVVTTRADGRWSHSGRVPVAAVSLDTRTLPEREGQVATQTTDPRTYAIDLADGTDREGLDFGVQWVTSLGGRTSGPATGPDPEEPAETADPSPTPTLEVESCDLVGLWDLRDQPFLDQLVAAGVTEGVGDVSIDYVSGVHTVEMRGDGTYTTVRGEWTLRTATADGAIVIAIDAVDGGTWSATDTELSIDDPGSTANVQMFVEQGGQLVPIPAPPGGATGSEPIAGSGPYSCVGDVLTVEFEGFVSTFDRIG